MANINELLNRGADVVKHTAVGLGAFNGLNNRQTFLKDFCGSPQTNLRLHILNVVGSPTHDTYTIADAHKAFRELVSCVSTLNPRDANLAAGVGIVMGSILIADRLLKQNSLNVLIGETAELIRDMHPIFRYLAVPAIKYLSTASVFTLPFLLLERAKILQSFESIQGNETSWQEFLVKMMTIPIILSAGKLLPAVVNVAQSGVIPLGRSIGYRVFPRIKSVGERIGDRVVKVRDARNRVLPRIRSVGESIGDRVVVEVRDAKHRRASREKPAREGPESIADVLNRSRKRDQERRQKVETFALGTGTSVAASPEEIKLDGLSATKRILFSLIFRKRLVEAIRNYERNE